MKHTKNFSDPSNLRSTREKQHTYSLTNNMGIVNTFES